MRQCADGHYHSSCHLDWLLPVAEGFYSMRKPAYRLLQLVRGATPDSLSHVCPGPRLAATALTACLHIHSMCFWDA